MTAKVFVITGPSGVGKGTLIRALREQVPELELSVSATTRDPRPGEVDGIDYHFLTQDQFDSHQESGDFIEWARYAGNRYGTLSSELSERLALGVAVVLEIEVQGARQVRSSLPDAVQVFIDPPSEESLRSRLAARGTDTPDEVESRLQTAHSEIAAGKEFAHRICNDQLEQAVDELVAIVRRELDS